MPTSVVPMLATKVGAPFSREGWLFEPKWDGYRAICFLRDGQVRFTSRNQRDLTKRFPELQSIAKSIQASTAIIDGEIVALDERGVQCFEQLQNHRRDSAILYFAFDLLYLDEESLADVPLIERKARLKRILPKSTGGRIRYTDHGIPLLNGSVMFPVLLSGRDSFQLVRSVFTQHVLSKIVRLSPEHNQ